ncbi:MAG: hypothetical protein OEM26_11470 [Saprospiraceae bacterium]|nr:hypothetical protein [Saprospiraceae bacterium]
MMLRSILGLSVVLIFCSCQNSKIINQKAGPKSGLRIESTPTRGLAFTDVQGMKYGLVYITTAMTNDTVIPIQIRIAFSKEYDYPITYGDEQFKVLLLPKVFALDGVEISDSLLQELFEDQGKPSLNETLDPNEECVMTIGILRPSRPQLCSATPYAILELSDKGRTPSCEWTINGDRAPDPELALGLKVGFCTVGHEYESCTVIPCGEISYPAR